MVVFARKAKKHLNRNNSAKGYYRIVEMKVGLHVGTKKERTECAVNAGFKCREIDPDGLQIKMLCSQCLTMIMI